jgi:hypothetical protein
MAWQMALGTVWIGGWFDPREGVDAVWKEKNSLPLTGVKSRPYIP